MIDRLQFRAWCEVPLKDDNGKEKVYGFYLYEINVYDGGKEIGFDENILSDNLSLYDFPDMVLGELLSHFTMNNCIISDNYFRYRKFKSIEQCTGLKDESGNLIYEGDIVDAYDLDRGVVEWVKSQYQIIRCQSKLPIILKSEMFVKIIGNVHENMNLLESNAYGKQSSYNN